jgi:transcription antitermination factor NusG
MGFLKEGLEFYTDTRFCPKDRTWAGYTPEQQARKNAADQRERESRAAQAEVDWSVGSTVELTAGPYAGFTATVVEPNTVEVTVMGRPYRWTR